VLLVSVQVVQLVLKALLVVQEQLDRRAQQVHQDFLAHRVILVPLVPQVQLVQLV
jgi:hypothetical protein